MMKKDYLERRDELTTFTYAVFNFADLLEEHLRIHRDSHYVFFLQQSGKSIVAIDFNQLNIEQATIGFILPDQIHQYVDLSQAEGYILLIDKSLVGSTSILELNKIKLDSQFTPIETTDIVFDFIRLCIRIVHEKDKDALFTTGSISIVAGMVECIVSRFNQKNTIEKKLLTSQQDVLTTTFKIVLEQKFHSIKQVKDYASLLNISPLYLNEVVKKTTGLTPIEMIHERIIIEAKRLLYYTTMSSKEISHQLGYDDYSYFSAFFKKAVGMSPSAFRMSYQEMQQSSQEMH